MLSETDKGRRVLFAEMHLTWEKLMKLREGGTVSCSVGEPETGGKVRVQLSTDGGGVVRVSVTQHVYAVRKVHRSPRM